ncbi:dienelactone hydrolase family protein [Rhodococcus sp. X156]|uniref:dienelactone hydrolase family protein n=1 Tax=Rhodococcus sp. X156 TaxID=2499145 RepID=UPI000FD99152|nr:dienelactone hydrolase family protein [Rhodococcus sp. X156]
MTAENPVQNVTFPSNGSTAHGYLKLPESGSGPGVIVIQEWWGLTTHIADVTDRLAAAGFVALAPDLYGGATAHDADEAGELMQKLPVDQAARDLSGAVDFLLGNDAVTSDKVGVVGFCMGGGFVISMAAQLGDKIAVAVPFYGILQTEPDFTNLTARMVGHFGTHDQMISEEALGELEAKITEGSGRAPEFYRYDAGHAFFNDENLMGTYDADKAKLAWDRTLDALHAELG